MSLPSDAFRHVASRPHEPLRTYHPRRAPLGRAREDALARLYPRYGLPPLPTPAPPTPHPPTSSKTADFVGDLRRAGGYPTKSAGSEGGWLDAQALFGRLAPLVLEIGPGMGDATAEMAARDPERDYLAVEAHLPGIAHLLQLVEARGLTNVRVGYGDALDLVRRLIAPASLAAVHAFFPDPWPKKRHHKRRLIQPEHVALLRSRLAIGGVLHVATDWTPYAEQMLDVLTADPGLELGMVEAMAPRPVTKFEARALAEGRPIRDLVAERVA